MALTEEGIIKVPGLLSRWVRLSTGVKAHYVTSGETGPAVVLLHGGIPGSSGTAGFRFMAPFLGAHGFRVYAPDMPGFGLTEDPNNFYGLRPRLPHKRGLHPGFANALALDAFHVAGNSMGCTNTVNYVVAPPGARTRLRADRRNDRRPGQPRTDARRRQPEQGPAARQRRHLRRQPGDDAANHGEHHPEPRRHHRRPRGDAHAAANRHMDVYDANMDRILRSTDPNEVVRLTTIDRFDRITLPGIYLFGRQDVLYAVEAAHLQEDVLPNVQFFYPENTGHQGQTDQPDLHNQAFLEFFRDGKVSWETAQAAGISTRRAPNPDLADVPADSQMTTPALRPSSTRSAKRLSTRAPARSTERNNDVQTSRTPPPPRLPPPTPKPGPLPRPPRSPPAQNPPCANARPPWSRASPPAPSRSTRTASSTRTPSRNSSTPA